MKVDPIENISRIITEAEVNYDTFLKDVKDLTIRDEHRNALEHGNLKQLPSLRTSNMQFLKKEEPKPKPKNLKMKHLMSDQAFLKFKRRKLFHNDINLKLNKPESNTEVNSTRKNDLEFSNSKKKNNNLSPRRLFKSIQAEPVEKLLQTPKNDLMPRDFSHLKQSKNLKHIVKSINLKRPLPSHKRGTQSLNKTDNEFKLFKRTKIDLESPDKKNELFRKINFSEDSTNQNKFKWRANLSLRKLEDHLPKAQPTMESGKIRSIKRPTFVPDIKTLNSRRSSMSPTPIPFEEELPSQSSK